jgi:hypothetical protein
MLKARVAGKFYHALDCDEPWAIQMAMRNQFGWDNGRAGFHMDAAALTNDRPETSVKLVFVVPGQREQPMAGSASGAEADAAAAADAQE